MNKLTYRLMSALAVFVLLFGNSSSAGASGTNQAATTIPAFPGAEGFGANSIGGRGGTIYEVTNLNDAGAGSLRACVEASGSRTCVFRVGGLIVLNSQLTISNPYITIAGQTAPGGGITLKKSAGGNVFSTQTHDVIIRYISSRPGAGGENHANQIAKSGVELYNIIIDHNSMSWGVDSNTETWYRVKDATIQWSIISEALDNSTHSKGAHSKGLMIGGYKGSESGGKGSENISVLNNLMAHNGERNPLMQLCGIAQVINNTTYNPFWSFSHQQLNCPSGESYVNWINNYHKKGPSSTSNSDLKVIPSSSGVWSLGKVYVKGNIGPSRPNDTLPETNWVEVKAGAPAGVIVTSPAPAPAVNSTTAMNAYNSIVADGGVGNSRGLNCDGSWYNRRDSIDVRVINDVKAGTGKIIDDPSQVGGWIVPAAGVPCTDSDRDGMPDAWEQGYGFNLNISDGPADKDADGYTNVEEYFNGTNPLGSISIPSSTPTSTLPVATITTSTVPVSVTATTATPTKTATAVAPTPTFVPVTLATIPAGQNTVEVRVANGADDVEESSTGSMYVNSSDLELVYDGSNQIVGMWFGGVNIPKGATITNAYLQFKVDETSAEASNFSIQGEASSNALAFASTGRNVSARLRTVSAVSWSPSSWLTLKAAGTDQRTPNMAPIVQEIVSQAGWAAGNSVVMIITGSGHRVAEAYEVNPAGAPLLHIEYIVAVTSATNTPTPTATTVSATPLPVTPTLTQMATLPPTATPTKTATIIAPTPTFVPVTQATIPAGQNIVDVRVTNGADDVEENSSGSIYTNSSDLELVYDGNNQVVGMRFRGVSVPKGATITNAYLQFKVDETSSEVTKISIQGEANSNASTFANTSRNVSARLRTTNAVSWSPSSWQTLKAAGTDQRTPNLAPIVQEIVSQAGWAAGNSLVMIITGSGKRVAEAYEANPTGAPLLHIEYTVATTSRAIMPTLTATTIPTTNTPTATATVISPTATLLPATPTISVTDTPSPTVPAQTALPTETPTAILPTP